jgi:predicted amidophosphoribosyltransferase
VSCFRYHPVLKYILRAYKYSHEKVLFSVIGKLLYEYSNHDPFLSFSLFRGKKVLVIPIPMHNNKLRERGYSVSLSVAQIFKKVGKDIFQTCTISEDIIIKNKETIAQAKVKKARRFVQQLGVFEIAPNAGRIISTINPDIIVIVDDVVSTGATAQSVLEAIKKQLSIDNAVTFALFSVARS